MPGDAAALLSRPATELAELVRSGQVRSRELVEAALAQIEAWRALNAFTYVDAEGALAAAEAIQPGDARLFAGVPTAIKELNKVAGQPLTMGSDLFGDYRPDNDDYTIARLKAAGFILVGRTSAPEMGIVPVTEPRRFGPTRNPWNLDHTPGGSSGGAAAAVAAGILPVAQGSDGGGSIRIPAACCGLVGLKVSRGRISRGPDLGDDMLSTNGALTRNVADSARLLDIMAGYEIGDATWAPPPSEPFAVAASRPPRPLRVALTTASPLGGAVDPAHIAATHEAGAMLANLGHHVEELVPPGWVSSDLQRAFTAMYGAAIATGVAYGAQVTERKPSEELVEPLTWAFFELALSMNSLDYAGARIQLQAYARKFIAFFERYDVLVTPTLAKRPLPIGGINTCGSDPWGEFDKAAAFTPFTPVLNVTGQPAISLPLFQGDDGLPTGVQFVGAPLSEALLLSLAAQLEAAHPWAARTPPAR